MTKKKTKRNKCECGVRLPLHLAEAWMEGEAEHPSKATFHHLCSCGIKWGVNKEGEFVRDVGSAPSCPIDST
jgi:hypothetical protein